MILHITTKAVWEQAEQGGSYRADSLETEGFIHCSTSGQVIWVANQFYVGQTNLVLLCIDPERLHADLRYEQVEGVPVENEFPHVYGPINLDAVIRVVAFEPDEDGWFVLPGAIAD